MCSRYYVDVEMEKEIMKVIDQITARLQQGKEEWDIHPSDQALVITERDEKLTAEAMRWGFPVDKGKKLVINARAETVREKALFADSVQRRRCAIPARGFYEWDKDKNKVIFTQADGQLMYLAGVYDSRDNEDRFVILTTDANESMLPVHDRMPLIFTEDEVGDWIKERKQTEHKLKQTSPQLNRKQDYEQLSLFI